MAFRANPGARGPSGVLEPQLFGGHFIIIKLLGTPNLVGVGHLFRHKIWIWKDLGLVCFWSHGVSLSWGVYNKSCSVCFK